VGPGGPSPPPHNPFSPRRRSRKAFNPKALRHIQLAWLATGESTQQFDKLKLGLGGLFQALETPPQSSRQLSRGTK